MVEHKEIELNALFAALSDQSRRTILLMLLKNDMTVQDIAEPFNTSLAAISKHIQVLAKAGIITQTKVGREKWCRLNPDALKPAAFWIESYGQFVEDSFEMLEQLLLQQDIQTS